MNSAVSQFEDVSIRDMLRWIASDVHGSPGAGSAAAISVALGASCVLKAIKITLHRNPGADQLSAAQQQASALVSSALHAAAGDAIAFAQFIKKPDLSSVNALLKIESDAGHLASQLLVLLEVISGDINDSMKGDLSAARVLCKASLAIVDANKKETERVARKVAPK